MNDEELRAAADGENLYACQPCILVKNGKMELRNSRAPPGWRIPTMDEFLQIYPSCSAAGNYAFITGPTNTVSLQWDDRGNMPDSILRVCVPYYRPGMPAPADTKKDTQGMSYRPGYEVWEQFHRDYEESGNFPSDLTWSSPRTDYNNGICPAYDPLPGQVSVYLRARKHDAIRSV